MALFGFGKKNNDTTPVNNTPVNTGNPTLNFNKEIPNTTAGLSLQKSVLSLDKTLITLEKKSGFSFDGHRAKVAVAMDYSGSMSSLYRNGAVQAVLTRLMPLALRFDDNGELDVWLFDNEYRRMPSMDLSNFDSYVDNEILRNRWHMGGTNYAPVLEDMLKKYFKEDAMTAYNAPAFIDSKVMMRSMERHMIREFEEFEAPASVPAGGWPSIYKNIAGVLDGTEELIVKPAEVLRVFRVMEAAKKSSREGIMVQF